MANTEKQVKICESTCEGVDFALYSDNDKYHYQRLELTRRVPYGKKITLRIAPVDFFTVASAIMCNDMLCDMQTDFGDTWSEEAFERALEDIFEE